MPSVSVTRLRLRSRRFIPVFFYYTWAVVRQARRSPGFLKGRLFMGSDRLPPAAMRKGAEWVQEASVVDWQQEDEELPSLSEAQAKMLEDGRLMPSHHPSKAHASGRVPEEPGLQSFVTLRPVDDD